MNKTLIKQIRQYALDHYNHDGWDYLVECYEDEDIDKIIQEEKVTNVSHAIQVFGDFLKIKAEHRAEVESYIF